ncbi:MAG TPA: sulfotransferase [Pirellulales bacterium]
MPMLAAAVDEGRMTDAAVPDFFVGGAPRSGTTFLAQALDRHPDVFMAQPFIPEPKVLIGPRQPAAVYRARWTALLGSAPAGALRGEKTSGYLESPAACQLLGEFAPRARLVFIVREPVSRAYSNYLFSRKNGLETLSFEEAIELEGRRASPLPPEKSYARPFDYLIRGDYGTFAERYFAIFGRAAIKFFLYEDIAQAPETLMYDVQTFLGLRRRPFAELDVGQVNSARELGPPLPAQTATRLRRRMQAGVERFAELTGVDVRSWGY